MKKHLNPFVLLLPLLLAASCQKQPDDKGGGKGEDVSSPITFNLEDIEDGFYIHTHIQNEFIEKRFDVAGTYGIDGSKELSKPESATFNWRVEVKDGVQVDSYVLNVCEHEDMLGGWKFDTGLETSKEVNNFKIHTDYYWTVTAKVGDKSYVSEKKHFKTADVAPRNLDVGGVTNVRDVGGWPIGDSSEGKYVKQGLLYRTGRLNKSSSDTPIIEVNAKGKDTMLNVMGVKTEIDLRLVENNEKGAITGSPLGSRVTYYPCPMDYETSDYLTTNIGFVKRVFYIMAQKNNYPIFFHCNIGTDRTGLIAYLVLSLLGVEEDYLGLDYEFSTLGTIGGSRHYDNLKTKNYVATIKHSQGDTLADKTRNTLIGLGVSEDDINAVVKMMQPD